MSTDWRPGRPILSWSGSAAPRTPTWPPSPASSLTSCSPTRKRTATLLSADIRSWLPPGHLAWQVIAVTGQPDLSGFTAAHRADGQGQAPYDPAMMVALLLFQGGPVVAEDRRGRVPQGRSTRGRRCAACRPVGHRFGAAGQAHPHSGRAARDRQRSTLSRCGPARRPWTRTGWCAVAPGGIRWRCSATRRRRGGCCWCGSTRRSIRRPGSGVAAARSPRAAGCG